jgi:hypothetical protein
VGCLGETYREATEHHTDGYVERHGRENSLRRQVDAFLRYREYVACDATVLEWGCKHAPDACLLRAELGDDVRIIGYDFDRGDAYAPFYDSARLEFRQPTIPTCCHSTMRASTSWSAPACSSMWRTPRRA